MGTAPMALANERSCCKRVSNEKKASGIKYLRLDPRSDPNEKYFVGIINVISRLLPTYIPSRDRKAVMLIAIHSNISLLGY